MSWFVLGVLLVVVVGWYPCIMICFKMSLSADNSKTGLQNFLRCFRFLLQNFASGELHHEMRAFCCSERGSENCRKDVPI